MAQPIGSAITTDAVAGSPLQEFLTAQPAVLMVLIAHMAGTPLQDDIVRTTGRLLRLGQDILATSAARLIAPVPDGGAGRDRLRDVLRPSLLLRGVRRNYPGRWVWITQPAGRRSGVLVLR